MRISLRFKLTLVSLLLFIIPLIGFRYSTTLKTELMASREEILIFTAKTVSTILSNRPDLFKQDFSHNYALHDIYDFNLPNAIRLDDATSDDWRKEINRVQSYGEEHVWFSDKPYNPDSLFFRHLAGKRDEYLYALFIVDDDNVVYRSQDSLKINRSDHLQITIRDRAGNINRYILPAYRPGWISAYKITGDFNNYGNTSKELRINGQWWESNNGYNLEIRIPISLGQVVATAVADVDDANEGKISTIIGNSVPERDDEFGYKIARSSEIEKILTLYGSPSSRIFVVNKWGYIRGKHGSLRPGRAKSPVEDTRLTQITRILHKILRPVYIFFAEPFSTDFADPVMQSAKHDKQWIEEAFLGKTSAQSFKLEDDQVEVMAATVPLWDQNQVIGAVVVEKTTNSILALKNRSIEESITLTVLAILLGGGGLLLFASRLSSRIRKLRNQASKAISRDGRVVDSIRPLGAKDEIGDLSRTLSSMLSQLKQQIDYREKMADNLEHEMRTPLAGISASLKNLASEIENLSGQGREYVQWALDDVQRLEELLTTIRDATTLQEALEQDFKKNFDIGEAISVWIEQGWQQTFSKNHFQYDKPDNEITIHGDPARIRQMLDKLVENAVDFTEPADPIAIVVEKGNKEVGVQVVNQGLPIDSSVIGQIFNSMVSFRPKKQKQPHFGLGLYIVRTIAEYHGGKVTADALSGDETGTVFTVTLPLAG